MSKTTKFQPLKLIVSFPMFFFYEESETKTPTHINEIFLEYWFLKYFIFWKWAQFLSALFIILVGLTITLFGEKVLISNRSISGLMSNLIKKSSTVSRVVVIVSKINGGHISLYDLGCFSMTPQLKKLNFNLCSCKSRIYAPLISYSSFIQLKIVIGKV